MRTRTRRLVSGGAVAALLVAGCSSAGSGGEAEPAAGDTITVQVSGGEGEIAALQELVDAFERERPGVQVDLAAIASSEDAVARLATSFAGGNPPDVFLLNYRRLGRFVAGDVIAPAELGDIPREDFYEPPLDAFTFDGELACLPQNVSSLVTYVNPALFTEAGVTPPGPQGWSLEQALDAARRLDAAGIPAIGFEPGLRVLAPFVYSAGGDIVDDLDRPTTVTLDTEPGQRGLQALLDLQATGLDATDRAAEDPVDTFARGEVAMLLESRRVVPTLRDAEELGFSVAPLPVLDQPASVLLSDGWCVSRDAVNLELVEDFASYAAGVPGGEVLARTGRTVPALRPLAEGPLFLDPAQPPSDSEVFLDVIPTLRRLPSVPAWFEAEEAATTRLEQLFAGPATPADVADAVAGISADSSRALAEGG